MVGAGASSDTGAMQTNATEQQSGAFTARRPTVFIAEDSSLVRERLVEMLERDGSLSVIGQAASPADAVNGILATRPDSVVLDIHLLGGSGLDVLRAIHPVEPRTVFVVLTNHANPQYCRAFMKAGANCVLDKSSEFQKVKDTLLAACGSAAQPH